MSSGSVEPAVLYAEVPSFYAEVERRDHAALADRPVLVGGDPRKRGRVQSASREALAAGVVEGMAMSEALELCPSSMRFRTDMSRYREASGAFVACLRRIVEELEPSGFGAVYLDVQHRPESPERLASRIAAAVQEELRLPLRVGIAPSKVLAQLAVDDAPEGGVRRVRLAEASDFLAPLPVSRLPRVGRKTEVRLHELGAHTVGELLALGRAAVERALGTHGVAIYELASGLDRSPVQVASLPRSISRERTLDISGPGSLLDGLRALATLLERELLRQGLGARRVALRARLSDQSTTTRSITLGEPVASALQIAEVAGGLAERLGVSPEVIRALALTVAGLVSAGGEEQQLELFALDRG